MGGMLVKPYIFAACFNTWRETGFPKKSYHLPGKVHSAVITQCSSRGTTAETAREIHQAPNPGLW
jgi:hypothetical protein